VLGGVLHAMKLLVVMVVVTDGRSNVLSVRNFDSSSSSQEIDIRHYRVRNRANDHSAFYVIKTNTFSSINNLISHYQRTYVRPVPPPSECY